MMQNSHRLSASEIAARLAEQMPALCHELLPAGRHHGQEWRIGSVGGESGQSLAVRLTGTKKGVWCDFAAGEGGDALGLIKAVLGLGTREAMAWATRWLGIDDTGAGGGADRHHQGGVDGAGDGDDRHQQGGGDDAGGEMQA